MKTERDVLTSFGWRPYKYQRKIRILSLILDIWNIKQGSEPISSNSEARKHSKSKGNNFLSTEGKQYEMKYFSE
jgi:hypothetical protein